MSDVVSTDVAVSEQPAAVPLVLRDNATEIEAWAFNLSQAYAIAVRLVTTSFVPRTYDGKPAEAAAAIMTGQELGMSPLAALRSIDIISGVPAMRAIALRALVQSKGHEIWTEESTATQAVVAGRRRGSDKVERSVWTLDRARGLNLLGKDNWKKQPIAMLLARATSELVRLIAADVLLGIPYSVEEIEDLGVVEAKPVVADAPRQSSGRSVKRQPVKRAEPEPEPEPVDDAEGPYVEEHRADPDREPDERGDGRPEDPEAASELDKSVAAYVDESREERVSAGRGKRKPAEVAKPFEGDPSKPTAEELAEWGALPMDGE